nr:hypothetical protein [Tanacetum cinerariifolium]
MVNARHREVFRALTCKGAKLSTSDAEHDDRDNESSSSSEDLNFRGQTTNNLKEVVRKELEGFKRSRIMSDFMNEMATYRDFTACDVPRFDGVLDLIASTRWLVAIESAFRTSNCKEKNKVNFASNFLRDSAKMWRLRKLKFGDRDTKKPKQDHNQRSGGTQIKTPCKKCHKTHLGVCRANFPGCYKCGVLKHMSKDCKKPMILCYNYNQIGYKSNECPNPKAIEAKPLNSIKEEKVKKAKVSNSKARVYMMATKEDKVVHNVVTGAILVNFIPSLNNKVVVVSDVYREVEIDIDDSTFSMDLIPIMLRVFDRAIDMDWLDKYNANILCSQKLVRAVNPKDTSFEKKSVKDVSVVNELLDVFPEDLLGIPLERQVKFRIDFIPNAIPIAKTSTMLDKSVIVFIDDILVYSKSNEEHEVHLRKVLETLRNERLFIQDFSKIASSLTKLTKKNTPCMWGKEQEEAFDILRKKLIEAPILVLSKGTEDMVVYNDASYFGLGCVLMSRQYFLEKKDLNMRKRRWLDLLKDYDCKIRYHFDKANMLADEKIRMDFVTKLPRTTKKHDVIWVIADRLTKSAHFILIWENTLVHKLVKIYVNEIVTRHGVPVSIVSDKDGRFTSNFWRDFHEELVSSWKGVLRFKNKGKLSLRFIGPFKILKRIGEVACVLELLEEMRGIHNTFHVSYLRKCLADESSVITLDDVEIDSELTSQEEPMIILGRKSRQLGNKAIPLVKVEWKHRKGSSGVDKSKEKN